MEKDSFTGRTPPALRTPSLARACVWSGVQVIVIGHHANGNCFHFRQSHYLQVHSHFSHIKTAAPRDRKHSASYLHSRPSEGETNRFSLNSALASLYPQHLGGRVFGPPLSGGSPPATPPSKNPSHPIFAVFPAVRLIRGSGDQRVRNGLAPMAAGMKGGQGRLCIWHCSYNWSQNSLVTKREKQNRK